MPPCLVLSIIRYGSRVKWVNPRKEVEPSSIPSCCSYRKGSLRVTLDYGRPLTYNYVKVTNVDESVGRNISKFVQVKIPYSNSKLQLDIWSDLRIINVYEWKEKKEGKPALMITKKIVRSVTGQKIKFDGGIYYRWDVKREKVNIKIVGNKKYN